MIAKSKNMLETTEGRGFETHLGLKFFVSSYGWFFTSPFTSFIILIQVTRHFDFAREIRSRWFSKCIVGLFWETNLPPCSKCVPKTVPQCTLTTILTRSPAQPQSGDYSHSPCSAIDRHVTAKCGLSQNFANTPWAACLKPVNGKCPNNFKTLDDPDGNSMYKACGSSMVCCLLTPVVNLQVITCKSLRH